MKKTVIYIVIIILGISAIAILIFAGMKMYDSHQIPELKITNNNSEVEVSKHPFSWSTLIDNRKRDYASASFIAGKQSAAIITPESTLIFDFNNEPDDFTVTVWGTDADGSEYEKSDNGIIVPKEKGIYVFSVIGKWKQGQVLYVFKISVE
ncbi:MAG: hypothetical protein ACYCYM_11860 [Saccharofermentanales bacterium]